MPYLSTFTLTPSESFELWREVTRGTYDVAALSVDEPAMRLSARLHRTMSLTLSEFSCQRNQKWRDRSHLSRDSRPYLKVRRYFEGGAALLTDGQSFRLKPGATYLLDQSRTFTELSTDNRQQTIFVPHDLIGYDASVHQPVIEWPDAGEAGHVLVSAIAALWDAAFKPKPLDPISAEETFVDTLRGVLAGGADSFDTSSLRDARARAIMTRLDHHLLEAHARSVDEIIADLPVSRASLYRHFRDRGGIARHLRRRRMERAFQMLSKAKPDRGVVSRVAERSGFASIHSFTKTFKRETGFAPTEILGTRAVTLAMDGDTTPKAVAQTRGAEEFARAFRRLRAS